jgi:hypothetical protein
MGIIVASGYGGHPQGALRADERVVFLKKPFDAEAVGRALDSLGI